MDITIEDILTLGPIPAALHNPFLRVANGLITRADYSPAQVLRLFAQVLDAPKKYAYSRSKVTNVAKEIYELKKQGIIIPLSEAGRALLPQDVEKEFKVVSDKVQAEVAFDLRDSPLSYQIFGADYIEAGALRQMETAVSLPISVAGALMPDAHQGYGLPIGGVLATQANTIIPYAVGVDIACRMCLSVFDISADYFKREPHFLKKTLLDNTKFGTGGEIARKHDESVMDLPDWGATKLISSLKDKAYRQLGTSGTGNHFVEWGLIEVLAQDELLGLPVGSFLALLSHSGSRGLGATIAGHYSKLAMQKTKLPKQAAHLAWLDLDTQEGQEYWIGMNLAGEYASANHHEIHAKIARDLREKPMIMVENHHNFAWRETLSDGTEAMVHRKGATPAGANDLGIIPGSMTASGFVVRGKGHAAALQSASHGAGRLMSRTQALSGITKSQMNKILDTTGVQLVGSDLDEAPMAYKDINTVMAAQTDLVQVLAKFSPKIVRMADANRRERRED